MTETTGPDKPPTRISKQPNETPAESLSDAPAGVSSDAETPVAATTKSVDVTSPATQADPIQNSNKVPDGIMPLFLTGATQALYKVVIGQDVNEGSKYKMIPKADFLADFQSRLAIGDFYPAKAAVMAYPQDQLLLAYDAEWQYGQNFFLCLTVEAKDALLNPILAEANAAEEPVEQKRSGWVPLGSDKDIEHETVVDNRELVTIKLSRKRKYFGSPCKFMDRDAADGHYEIRTVKDATPEVLRVQLSKAIQSVPVMCDAIMQTIWFKPVNFSAQYESLRLDDAKKDAVMRNPDFSMAVQTVAAKFERPLRLNAIMDIFRDDFADLGEEDVTIDQGSHIALQEYQSFTDLKHSKDRSIACVDWHPAQRGIVAMSCVQRSTQYERIEVGFANRKKALILIWSFFDPIHPQLMLEAPDDILCFRFHPQDPNIVVGGCINGQVVLWDISEHHDRLKQGRKEKLAEVPEIGKEAKVETPVSRYIVVSSIEHSHRAPITDIGWLQKSLEVNKLGDIVDPSDSSQKQLYTTSTDGQILFWDLRYKPEVKLLDLVWRPLFKTSIPTAEGGLEYGVLKISLHPQVEKTVRNQSEGNMSVAAKAAESSSAKDIKEKDEKSFASKFFCATEEGDVVYADWIPEKEDKDGSFCHVEFAAAVHFAPMSDLSRSPFFPDIVLSVGGWSFHIWKEKLSTGPLLSSATAPCFLTACNWSPTRPGVFFIGKEDGSIEMWDLLDKSHGPSASQNVCSAAISSLTIQHLPQSTSGGRSGAQQLLGVGDDEGTLHLLEVPRALSRAAKNEKTFVKAYFEREIQRLQYVAERRIIRAKEKGTWEASTVKLPAKKEELSSTTAPSLSGNKLGDVDSEEREKRYLSWVSATLTCC
ncbi:WD40 repeat-like protein [Gonapodya prolifera JEL478]|uniref:WD40 repeat-like protein n=1 Tax=Gonapodya prolifera (strain JEL478) TaxID=1344416 RepID=A0A139AUK2_GONPJ|nr:WD40 repeat-like protein [Gonapodya prolifera JEL478]|eukprot:KXS20411.1 WD40 repeat-like protein [Gonapodya prolifera JEL478]